MAKNTETKEVQLDEETVTLDYGSQDQALAVVEPEERIPTTFTTDLSLDMSQIQLSRLKLMHGISPEVTNGDAQVGTYFLEDFGTVGKTVSVIPIGFSHGEFREAFKNGKRLGMACYDHIAAPEVDCPNCRVKWDPEMQKGFEPTMVPFQQWMVYIPEQEMPATISFTKKALRTASAVIAKWVYVRKMGTVAFELGVAQEKAQNGSAYFVPTAKVVRDIAPEEFEKAQVFMGGNSNA